MIKLHAIYSRIVANVLVISVEILVNLLVKLTKSGIVGGAMGGAYPLYESLLPDRMRREARAVGVCGETCGDRRPEVWSMSSPVRNSPPSVRPVRLMRLMETSEGKKRLPLYDFRWFPDFLASVLPSVVLSLDSLARCIIQIYIDFLGRLYCQVQSRHIVSLCQVYCSPVSLVIF